MAQERTETTLVEPPVLGRGLVVTDVSWHPRASKELTKRLYASAVRPLYGRGPGGQPIPRFTMGRQPIRG